MNFDEMKKSRSKLNALMMSQDIFFQKFSTLDNEVYCEGAISKKNKELIGLAISVVTRCNECIAYHTNECKASGANLTEVTEAIRIGVIAGGSITYPNARFAYALLSRMTDSFSNDF